MKSAGHNTVNFGSWLLAGLCLCLGAGCASSSTQNKQVYDRYAELVAARNRAPVSSPAKDSQALDRRPLKSTPAAKPAAAPAAAPAAPAQAAAPAAKPAPTPAPAPAPKTVEAPVVPAPSAPAPVSAPPVQVMVPQPAEPPAPPPPAVAAPVPVPPAAPAAAPAIPLPAAAVSPASSASDGNAYTLKVGDGVQVYLRGIPMSDAIEDQIDENGKISLPLINEIQAAGMTASDLEQNIRKTYLDQDIYRNITVNVVVPTRFYFIQGEIRAPGRFQIQSATRVSQAIAGAGGYTEYASGQVVVKRGGKIFKTIRNSRRLERTPDDDILLEPDDIIEVKRSLW